MSIKLATAAVSLSLLVACSATTPTAKLLDLEKRDDRLQPDVPILVVATTSTPTPAPKLPDLGKLDDLLQPDVPVFVNAGS